MFPKASCLLIQLVLSFLFSSSTADYKSSGLLCASMIVAAPLTTYLDRILVSGQADLYKFKRTNVAWLMDFIKNGNKVTDEFLTLVEGKMKRLNFDADIEFTQRRLLFIYNVLQSVDEEFKKIETKDLTNPLKGRVEKINKNVKDLKNNIEANVLTLLSKEIDGLVGELDSVQSSGIAGVSKAFVGELKDNLVKLKPEVMDLKSKKDRGQIEKVTSRVKILEDLFITLKTTTTSAIVNRLYARLRRFTGSKIGGVIDVFES